MNVMKKNHCRCANEDYFISTHSLLRASIAFRLIQIIKFSFFKKNIYRFGLVEGVQQLHTVMFACTYRLPSSSFFPTNNTNKSTVTSFLFPHGTPSFFLPFSVFKPKAVYFRVPSRSLSFICTSACKLILWEEEIKKSFFFLSKATLAISMPPSIGACVWLTRSEKGKR